MLLYLFYLYFDSTAFTFWQLCYRAADPTLCISISQQNYLFKKKYKKAPNIRA